MVFFAISLCVLFKYSRAKWISLFLKHPAAAIYKVCVCLGANMAKYVLMVKFCVVFPEQITDTNIEKEHRPCACVYT